MLEASEDARMEQNENIHDFSIAHAVGLITVLDFLVFNYIFYVATLVSLKICYY